MEDAIKETFESTDTMREEYRQRMADILRACHGQNGTTAEYRTIITMGDQFKGWLAKTFSEDNTAPQDFLTEDQEIALAKKFTGKEATKRTTATVMAIAEQKHLQVREIFYNRENLRTAIITKVNTPHEWATMTQKAKEGFQIHGHGLNAIARRFDVAGNPVFNPLVFIELGKKIFGEHPDLHIKKPKKRRSQIEMKKAEALKVLKKKIIERKTTNAWVKMTREEKETFEIDGQKLKEIAQRFDVTGNPITNPTAHLELGGKIYGPKNILAAKKRHENLNKMREKETVQQLQELERIYRECKENLYRFLRRHTDHHHALDIIQQAFTNGLEKTARGEKIPNIKAYLFSTGGHLAKNIWKEKRVRSFEDLLESGKDFVLEDGKTLEHTEWAQ